MRLPIVRKPRGQACSESFAVSKYRALCGGRLCEAAGDHHFERGVEKDDAGVLELSESMARSLGLDGSAAEGHDKVLGLGVAADGFRLNFAKGSFAALREELSNGASSASFEDSVGVEEAPAELLREQSRRWWICLLP